MRFPANRSSWTLGRMKAIALSLGALLAVANAGRAASPEAPMTNIELVRELRSYGEERRDLVALFIPFLAEIGFTDSESKMPDASFFGETSTIAGSNGDFIGIRGRYNCIVLVYYSTLREDRSRSRTLRTTVDAFDSALTEYVARLPSPKLTLRSVTWGATTCANAT